MEHEPKTSLSKLSAAMSLEDKVDHHLPLIRLTGASYNIPSSSNFTMPASTREDEQVDTATGSQPEQCISKEKKREEEDTYAVCGSIDAEPSRQGS